MRAKPTAKQKELAAVLRKCGVQMWRIAYTVPVEVLQQVLDDWIAEVRAGANIGPGLLYRWIQEAAEDDEPLPEVEAPDLRTQDQIHTERLLDRHEEQRVRRLGT